MQEEKYWGYHLILNASGLNGDKIRSADFIKQFLVELCDKIKMKRFGDPIVVDFGEDEKVSGFTFVQLIETSNIAGTVKSTGGIGHLVNQNNSGYFDVFSCSPFDENEAIEFIMNSFEAKSENHTFIKRLAPELQ